MKRFILGLLTFLICFNLYSKDLQVVSTKYFDIIYDAEFSSSSAALLTKYADAYADEIFKRLSVEPFKKKLPVYIKPSIENLNGYYTTSPYKHIVIFDTTPTDGVLANQTDTLLKVFYHELTHAISLKKSAMLAPLAMREGVAVSFESFDGEGRLNDTRILHQFAQNRIDETSPSWSDAASIRDTYPGAFWGYVYGGAFSNFLQEVYGMEKYSEIWNGSMKFFSRASFKKKFGKKLTTVWDDFLLSIPFPQDVSPEKPLFTEKDYTSTYSASASSINGFAVADSNSDKILFFANSSSGKKKTFSIRTAPFVHSLAFSKDGGLLAISDIAVKKGVQKNRVLIYDVFNKRFLKERYFSLRYACFSDDSSSICGVEVNSQFSKLVLINRFTGEKKTLFESGPGLPYSSMYSVTNAGSQGFAFIGANGISRDILFINPQTMKIKKLKIKQEMQAISHLQSNVVNDETVLTFSWTNKGSLCKMASYNVDSKEFRVLKKNVNGGTFFPVVYGSNESQNNENFAVIGIYATHQKLSKIHFDELEAESAELLDFQTSEEVKSKKPNTKILNSKKYNPIMNMWIPSIMPYFVKGPSLTDFEKHVYGLKFSSHDITKRLSYSIAGGIMPKPLFASFDFKGSVAAAGTETSLYVREQLIHDETNDKNAPNLHKTGFGFGNEALLYEGTHQNKLNLKTNVNFDWFALCSKDMKNIYKQKHSETLISLDFGLEYSDFVRKIRLDYPVFAEDIYGVSLASNFAFAYHVQNKTPEYQVQALTTFKTPEVPLTIQLSGVVGYNMIFNPIKGTYAVTGAPGILSVKSYLPKMNAYTKLPAVSKIDNLTGAFGLDASIRILSVEIQKASLWLPICFNRFNIDTGYKSVLTFLSDPKEQKPIYLQALYLAMTLDISGAATVGFSYSHPLVKNVKFGAVDVIVKLKL